MINISDLEKQVIPGKKYKHFKGDTYVIIGLAHHSETLEPLVVYQGLYDSEEWGPNPIWVRPLSMFFDYKEIKGKKVPRFKSQNQ